MRFRTWWRLLAVVALLGLVAAACGDDSDSESDSDTTEASTDDTTDDTGGEEPSGDALVMGRMLPETGSLAFLGTPMIYGFDLAVEDINAGGGVFGTDLVVVEGDEGEAAAQVSDEFQRFLGEGVTVFLGAAASGQSQEILQTAFDEQVLQCSASNTGSAFTEQEADNAGYYIRTVPPDDYVAPVIADTVAGAGAQNVAVVARQDEYGDNLLGLASTALTDVGANVVAEVSYNPDADTFDAEVTEILDSNPDAVVVISFAEGAGLIQGLLEGGLTPDQLYGADGIFAPSLPSLVDESDPNVLDGMTVVGAAGDDAFNERMNEVLPEEEQGNFLYAGQAYDCAIVMALAAEQAGTPSPTQQDAIDVTEGGTACTTYEECLALIAEGDDIDYNGVAGTLDLDEVGDPTGSRYAVAQFTDGALEVVSSQDVAIE